MTVGGADIISQLGGQKITKLNTEGTTYTNVFRPGRSAKCKTMRT